MLSYQKWFYPEQDMNYINHWRMDNMPWIDLQLPHHKQFQPQLTEDYNCAALIMTGRYKIDNWQWVTINCSEVYPNTVIICEQAHNDTNMQHWPNAKDSAYEKLLYSSKINSILEVPKRSCKSGWIFHNDGCFNLYLGIFNDIFGC